MRTVVAKVVLALAGAVAAAVLGARGADVIDVSGAVALALLVVVALVAVATASSTAISEYRRKRAEIAVADAERALTAALWTIVDLLEATGTRVDFRDLSLAVYRLRQRRLRKPVLERVHMLRARNRPEASGIAWRPGLGVLGTCLLTGKVEAQDFSELSATPELRTETDWLTLPEDIRRGLRWAQFDVARGKYGTIVAAPSSSSGSGGPSVVLGCATLDGPPDMVAELSATPVVNQMLMAADGLLQP